MKSLFGRSALLAAALLAIVPLSAAKPSLAQTAAGSPSKRTTPDPSRTQMLDPVISSSPDSLSLGKSVPETAAGKVLKISITAEIPVSLSESYVATAYSLRGRTASGKFVSKGIIAADPRHLPLGSRVHVQAGAWSGEYMVADTGGAIKGRKIDIWTPSTREAMRFGRRKVKLTVLRYGVKRVSSKKRVRI